MPAPPIDPTLLNNSVPSQSSSTPSKKATPRRSHYETTGVNPEPLTMPAAKYIEFQIERQKANARKVTYSRPLSDYSAKPVTQFLFSLDDFILLRTLGTGTFGRVHLSRYAASDDRFFAIKVMKKSEIIRLSQLEHVYCEKQLLSHLKHPFIVALYATFQTKESLFMVMEYVIGGELFSYLRRATRFCQYTTVFYAAEIVLALEYLHAYDIVYRDLKPENLLLDAQGHIKLTDFGFAKVLYKQKTWTLCGTPEYLAPEIILGKGHDKMVDWWALGILVFEMLAGYPPFFDQDNYSIYEKILKGVYLFPPYVDELGRDFVRRLLVVDPNLRLGSKRGAVEVMEHSFFSRIAWRDLYEKKIEPPFIPQVAHSGDAGNFEKYQEEQASPSGEEDFHLSDPYESLFKYF